MEFNKYANPKVETKRFKIYADVSESSDSPEWELQGKGVESWTVEENSDVTKTTDVLGEVDMERGAPQPTQSGVAVKLRKSSKLGMMLFNAWFTRDFSALNSLKILHKYEFVNSETAEGEVDEANCLARLEEGVMIAINSFTGEAGGYLGFEIDIHYANKSTTGTMPIVDSDKITFTPDTAA